MKKKLTTKEEFSVMLLVLDKFLWLGFGIMAFGLYQMFMVSITNGLLLIIAGAIVLLLFMVIIVKEYEIIK
ncbi:hypothetical protein KY312_02625 [Candidatus Woesearchaeota archaeon]|nr:hypothetical protein [Candidatus Woesearchaeota archaeon]